MGTIYFLSLAFLISQTPSLQDRERHPLAPSLPVLTRAEEDAIEKVIDRFIQAEMGKAPAAQIEKAKADLYRLGPEAFFLLVEGLNRAANIEASCPSVVLRDKVKQILARSTDADLLTYAKETIGSGVTAARFKSMLADLRVFAMVRRSQVARLGPPPVPVPFNPPSKALSSLSTGDLVAKANSERGLPLQNLLTELAKRKSPEVYQTLGLASSNYDKEVQALARKLLRESLSRLTAEELKGVLKDGRVEVRAAVARTIGERRLPLAAELIELLADDAPEVHQGARQALMTLSNGQDFGPRPEASPGERAAAAQRWREWSSHRFGPSP